MNPNDSDSETITWLNYAIDDLKTAKLILSTTDDWIVPRNICYLCQQAVEKALKAIYVYENHRFHKIHDLVSLKNNLPNSWKNFGNTLQTPPNVKDATTAYTQAKEIAQKIVKEFISRSLSFQDKLLEKL